MTDKKKRFIGRGALITTTLIWGTSFVILKSALDDVTPLWALFFRFSGAAVLMLLFAVPRLKMLDKDYLRSGALMGLLLALEAVFEWDVVWCNIIALALTGTLNFLVGEKLIFARCHKDGSLPPEEPDEGDGCVR